MKFRFKPKLVFGGLAVSAVLGLAASWWIGGRLVRPANRRVSLPEYLAVENVAISGSGHSIAASWLDAGPSAPAVLLLHALRADRASMASRARLLADRGFSVLLIDLQAHGETPGSAITFGLRESADAHAAYLWLRRLQPRRRVGVIGCSLGGASVLLGPQPSGFDAVVLESVYPRVAPAVENRIRIRLGSLAPALAPLLLAQLPLRLRVSAAELEPIRFISNLGSPVLIVAGSDDRHTTLAESQQLFGAAVEPKKLWVVPGAKHQDFLAFDSKAYADNVVGFLDRHLRPSDGGDGYPSRTGRFRQST